MKTPLLVRFPNEYFFTNLDVDLSKFRLDKEIGDELFGWYEGIYICIKKED
jgi:hypothetical protein